MKTRSLKVAVIGGGIGGLTAALALRNIGAEVRVFERAPEIKEVGAGLSVWANAVRVLDALGLGEQLRAVAQPIEAVGMYSSNGQALNVTNIAELTRELGVPSFLMHRADLQRTLLAALPAEHVRTGATCSAITDTGNAAVVDFDRCPTIEADLVIGADGFNSVVRHQLWGQTPVRYSGQTCYRGVVNMPVKRPNLLGEIQGRGCRLGHCPLGPDRIYWFACHNAARNEPEDPRGAKSKLLEMFRDWPFDFAQIILATPNESILRNDLCDRAPLTRWSRGHVTLVGDAAHPMLPNLGQGACAAIEDAVVLARCIGSESNLDAALARYESERIPRTKRMVELSSRIGSLARWKNPLAVAARESLLRWTPVSMMRNQLCRQLDFDTGVAALALVRDDKHEQPFVAT